jgi:hypothetical protein
MVYTDNEVTMEKTQNELLDVYQQTIKILLGYSRDCLSTNGSSWFKAWHKLILIMSWCVGGCVCLWEAAGPQLSTLCCLKKLIPDGGRAFSRSHLRAPSPSFTVGITGNKYPARKNIQLHTHFLSIYFI